MTQIENLKARLLALYVARDNASEQVKAADTEITTIRNLLAGADIGLNSEKDRVAAEATVALTKAGEALEADYPANAGGAN